MPVSRLAEKNFKTLMNKATDPSSAETAITQLDRIVHDTQNYIDGKNALDADFAEFLISRELFTWQKDYLVDKANRITLQCGRRSGKSYANAMKALAHCLYAKDVINNVDKFRSAVIVGLTKDKVQQQYWQLLKTMIDKCHLPIDKIDNGDLSIRFANGATLKLAGNNSKADREKLRGDEYSLMIIDEAQSQQGLRYLMESIFEPIAYARNSSIVLSGTGALILGCYWQEVTDGDQSPKWKHYTATMKDNPTVANADKVLEQVLKDKGWTVDDPEYIREYLGQNCVESTRSIIADRHYYDTLPDLVYEKCIVGTDYGWNDKTSFVPVLIANNGKCFVVDEFSSSHMSASEIVDKAKEIEEHFRTKYKVPEIMLIADTSDQTISADIYRCGIKICNAYKVAERLQWSYLRDACRTGDILLKKGGIVDKECDKAVWKYDEDTKQIIQEPDDDVFHPESLDALKYAYYYIKTKKVSAAAWKK